MSHIFSENLDYKEFPVDEAELCMELADWFDHPLDELEVCEDTYEYSIASGVINDEGLQLAKVQFRAKLITDSETLEVYFHITKNGEVYYMYE